MAEVLTSLSDAMAELVETASKSIVRIEARRRLPATGIVWSADGVILTAHHIIESDEEIQIGLPDGSTAAAVLVGRDPSTDVAVLRAQGTVSLTAPTWAELDTLKVGHLVLALGRPGEQVQATLGVISALSNQWTAPQRGGFGGGRGRGGRRGGPHRRGFPFGGGDSGERDTLIYRREGSQHQDPFVQTDVVMYPGFSGGPLVGAGGQILGMNTSALMRGISLTIPTPTVRRVIETLLTHGKVRRGYLGVTAQPVKLPDNLAQELDQEVGLMVIAVEPDSPAHKGGMVLGDVLVALGDEPVENVDELLALLRGDQVGKALKARIVRGGQLQEVEVTVGERS